MCKILIVDDALFMRHSLKIMLEKNGFEVVGEAENGKVAVQKYKQLNPDIVTMDITMPEMDGIQAVREIKQIDSKAKIIMISAIGQESYISEAIVSGAIGFIVKPFKEEIVIKAMNRI